MFDIDFEDFKEKLETFVPIVTKRKNTYKVPVVWSAMGYVLVEADDVEEAKNYVKEHLDEFPLPRDGEYLDDSFEVDEEGEAIYVP